MECPVCFNIYSTSVTVALNLECCHTICKQCCDNISRNNTIKCPICLKETSNVSGLRMCQVIKNIINSRANLSRSQIMRKSDNVSIIVRNLLGHTINFTLSKKCTILKLKEMVKDAENVSVNSQWLLFNGKTLNNEQTLEEADIEDMDMIYLVFRSFGG